jgi:acetolactate synthase-1/2/3 large subunit
MLKTGAEIVIECLLEQEVDIVFGYPGGTILNVYDALYKYNGKIKHILTSHEQGASHAADGYARSTGKVGVCFATSGPGSTNLTTGIATAYMDSSPVVFISCNVGEDLLDRDSFQEVKMTSITKAITKCNYLVKDVNQLADIIREAFYVAKNGRPGPVVIDILKNVTAMSCEYEYKKPDNNFNKKRLATNTNRPTYMDNRSALDEKDLDRAAKMINDAKRPLIVCGGGVVLSRANDVLTDFANTIDSPVAFTVMGCGGYDGEKERATGLIGMHGTQSSNIAVANCDLLIVVGCRFSDRVALNRNTFAKQAQILQIDIDRNEIDKNVKTTYHVVGDAKKVLEALLKRVNKNEHKAWVDFVFSFPTETEYEFSDEHLNPKQIAMAVKEIAPKYSMVTTDVGQHQMWAIQHFNYHYPGQLITSVGFVSMGLGLGAAIVAKV